MCHITKIINFNKDEDKIEFIDDNKIKLTIKNKNMNYIEKLRKMKSVKIVLFDDISYYLIIEPSQIHKFMII